MKAVPTSTAPRDLPPQRAVTALAGFLCALLAAPGQTFVLALYVEPLMGSLDASRATVSHWCTVATLCAAVLLVPVGRLADRWPPERFLLAVLIGMGVALIILSRGTAAWQVIATFTVLRLCGQGATGVGILALVVRRFSSGRGRLLSITQLGHPAGELIFPSLILLSLQLTDWRDSMAAVGGVYVLVTVPLLSWLLLPSAARTSGAPSAVAPVRRGLEAGAESGLGFGAALRQRLFWLATGTRTETRLTRECRGRIVSISRLCRTAHPPFRTTCIRSAFPAVASRARFPRTSHDHRVSRTPHALRRRVRT